MRLSLLRPLSRITRPLRLAAPLVVLVLLPIAVPGLLAESADPAARLAAQVAAPCTVTGVVAAGQTRLPGVEVTATPQGGGKPAVTSTGLDGVYTIALPAPGTYEMKAELAAFATVTRELATEKVCGTRIDLVMTLASRAPAAPKPAAEAQAQAGPGTAKPATPAAAAAKAPAARAQGTAGQRAQGPQFQRVGANATGSQTELTLTSDDAAAVNAHLNLPPGFTADTMSDTVTAFGSTGQTNDALLFGPGGMGMFGDRGGDMNGGIPGMPGTGDPNAIGAGGFGGEAGGIGGGRGGPGGGGGRGGGFAAGGPGGGRGGQRGGVGIADRLNFANRMRTDQPHGQFSYQIGGSPFDAAPYSLTGKPNPKENYLQQRFTGSVGGQFKIPHLFDLGPRTSYFLNYSGNHSSNAYSALSTVPTDAERQGIFPATAIDPVTGGVVPNIVRNPLTGQQYPNNTVPISPAAAALLQYIPRANQQPGATTNNFYYSTTTATSSDDINFRFIRQFGAQTRRGQRGAGGGGGIGGGGGRGGGGFGGGTNVNFSVHYHRQESTQATPFGMSSGTSSQHSWDIPVGVSFTTWGVMNQLRADYNLNNTRTTNAFAGVSNPAGDAGLQGGSTDPVDWGLPTLSFSGFAGLTDITPSSRHAQTFSLSDAMIKSYKRHNMRWGFGFSDTRLDSRTDANARGTYVFSGTFTGGGTTASGGSGTDFADFLLGYPQSAMVQYGPGTERFRSQSLNTYFQDDWRLSSNFTLNLGVRWEYQSPYSEADNRLATLDVNSGFTAAVPVLAGGTGPYYGQFSSTLVNPDHHAISPRVGLAWRPKPKWVVRGGYGINYASVPYLQIAQKLAAQPPFATNNTIALARAATPIPLATILLTTTQNITNNYGVDPNYHIGYVQMWNADVQHDLTTTLNVGFSYIGTHGSSLDMLRAPNRQPDGYPLIQGVSPFIWESSGGVSTMHAFSVRARKRLSGGFQVGGTYTYSKAFDNASTLGGGGGVVAQNDQNLAAEWGPSSFDVRHRFTSDFSIELPFGSNRRWLTKEGLANEIFGGWMLNGTLSFSSGTPYTALVAGAVTDVSNGVTGTLRADYNGQPIALSNPTAAEFFNKAAFSVPALGTFGTAGRNTIVGPGQRSFNMALMKNFTVRGLRTLSLRIQANNVLNMVVWRGINTTANSQGFGEVTSVGPMRSVQIILRAGF